MQINEFIERFNDYAKMDSAISGTLKLLDNNEKLQKLLGDGGGNVVERALMTLGRRIGVSNIKKLFDRFHDKIRKGEIPSRYSFYNSTKLASNDPRLVHVTEGVVRVINDEVGMGYVPNNSNIDYMGLRVMMKPSIFLKLAAPLSRDITKSADHIKSELEGGGAIASPFLKVEVPDSWFFKNDISGVAEIVGHEGRNRMYAVLELYGDIPIEVHLFFYGEIRNRHITKEWIESLNGRLIPERGSSAISGPFFDLV